MVTVEYAMSTLEIVIVLLGILVSLVVKVEFSLVPGLYTMFLPVIVPCFHKYLQNVFYNTRKHGRPGTEARIV